MIIRSTLIFKVNDVFVEEEEEIVIVEEELDDIGNLMNEFTQTGVHR